MPLKLFIKVFFSCESQRKKLTAPRSLCARAPRHCLRLCVCRARAPRPVHWADGVPQPGLCAGRGPEAPTPARPPMCASAARGSQGTWHSLRVSWLSVRVSWWVSRCRGWGKGPRGTAEQGPWPAGRYLLPCGLSPATPPPQADFAAPGPVHPPWGRPTSEGRSRRGGDQVNPLHVGSQGEQPALSWAVSEVPPQPAPLLPPSYPQLWTSQVSDSRFFLLPE